nr:GAF domain-containing sensor histidine kinase [Bacteroidota bacterium]
MKKKTDPNHPASKDFNKLSQKHMFELYEQMFGEVGTVNVLQKTSEVVSEILNAERATIYITIKETQELKSVAFIGNVSQSIIIPINNESLAGYCAQAKRSFVVPDAYGDFKYLDPGIRFDKSWDEVNEFRTRDVICVPAIFKGEVMGVVQAINSKGDPFHESDIIPLENISPFIAYALYHARLYDELATLKGLEKEKAEFMRVLVHELRSPVATSRMLVSTVLFTLKGDSQITSALNKVENRLDQLLLLVEDILHMSRIKSGNPLGDISIYDLAVETSTTFEKYIEEAEAKGLTMKLELPDYPVRIRIDIHGYRLILSNLISNGVKYTSSGSVNVSLGQNNKWAILKIRDTGMGIPKNDIPNLFTEFFRATNARNSKIIGTGIGLAGVKELVTRFGGLLELNTEENKGSEFIVRLPLISKQDDLK